MVLNGDPVDDRFLPILVSSVYHDRVKEARNSQSCSSRVSQSQLIKQYVSPSTDMLGPGIKQLRGRVAMQTVRGSLGDLPSMAKPCGLVGTTLLPHECQAKILELFQSAGISKGKARVVSEKTYEVGAVQLLNQRRTRIAFHSNTQDGIRKFLYSRF